MSRIFKKRRDEESNIDLTPMLDVVFIMLIFFIVTASFVSEQGFLIKRPPENIPVEPVIDQRNAVFVITQNNEIWLDERRIDLRSVRANIERIRAQNPNAKVVIRAHELSEADTYVQIADQAADALGALDSAVALVTYAD